MANKKLKKPTETEVREQLEQLITPTPHIIETYLRESWRRKDFAAHDYILHKLFLGLVPVNDSEEKILLKIAALNEFYSTYVKYPAAVAKAMFKIDRLDERILGHKEKSSKDGEVTEGKKTREYLDVVDEIANALSNVDKTYEPSPSGGDNLFGFFERLTNFLINENVTLGTSKRESDEIADEILGNDLDKKPQYFSFATKFCAHHDATGKYFPIYDSFVAKILIDYNEELGGILMPGLEKNTKKCKDEYLRKIHNFADVIDRFRAHYSLNEFTYKQIDIFLWQYGMERYKAAYEEAMKEKNS